jgi:serine/threonine protein kinase
MVRIVNNSNKSPALGLRRLQQFSFDRSHKIGNGGMGTIYQQKGRCSRKLAVKVNRLRDPKGLVLLESEAKILSQLDHPNIIKIQTHGVGVNGPFIAMELVDAKDLENHLRTNGRLSVKDALEVADKVADALLYAHKKKILHLDIKPANIMWKKGEAGGESVVKLIDFAFARKTGEWHVIEEDGQVFAGSPKYASLERLTGKMPKEREDVVSLGIVLFTLMTGEKAIRNKDYFAEHSMLGVRINKANLPRAIKELLWGMTGTTAKGEIRKYKIKNCRELKRRLGSIKALSEKIVAAQDEVYFPLDLVPRYLA